MLTQQLDYDRGLREYVERACKTTKAELVDFALRNRTVISLVKHLKRHTTGSLATLALYLLAVWKYAQWLHSEPDRILFDCWGPDNEPLPKMLVKHAELVDDFVGYLQDQGLAPGSIVTYVAAVKSLYKANKLTLELPRYKRPKLHPNKSPTPEELQRVLAVADLRERVVVTLLALGGFRIGTLSQLTYGHVKDDLERGIVPVMIRVQVSITKGAYADYYTFLGGEAVDSLKSYLESRRRGTEKLPPEVIDDRSPLIRDSRTSQIRPVKPDAIWRIVNNLYWKAGLIQTPEPGPETGNPHRGRRYPLRAHSLRYYFRTQLTALGVSPEYAEFMMGHKGSLYNDIKMKGPEFLRQVYSKAGLSIRPRTTTSKLDMAKEILRSFGYDPEKILVKEAMAEAHRGVYDGQADLQTLYGFIREAVVNVAKQQATPVNATPALA